MKRWKGRLSGCFSASALLHPRSPPPPRPAVTSHCQPVTSLTVLGLVQLLATDGHLSSQTLVQLDSQINTYQVWQVKFDCICATLPSFFLTKKNKIMLSQMFLQMVVWKMLLQLNCRGKFMVNDATEDLHINQSATQCYANHNKFMQTICVAISILKQIFS